MSSSTVRRPVADGQDEADPAIVVAGIGKCYHIYERPENRLKQALIPRVQRALGCEESRFFHESWALREISFTVARGETIGVIGRNGSGKSTLLQIVCGTLSPTQGSVEVSGRVAALLELGSGFNPEFTGRENVLMNGAILGMRPEEIAAKYDAIVAFADIGEYIEQPVKTYSSGMYVRLAFAVIAHADADILVIDEALSVGDVFFGQKCMRFLRDFQKRGTVLFVSHDSSAVVNLCDRAIWLDGGRIRMDGAAKEVSEAYRASAYGHAVNPARAGTVVQVESVPDTDEADDYSLDASRLRLFDFDPNSAGFGDGRATIVGVAFENGYGTPLSQVEGGEIVQLKVQAEAQRHLASPIIGFYVKDRLGQHLFGQNTYRRHAPPTPVETGGRIVAVFEFRMPHLPLGRYTLDVAVADGTQEEHVQGSWLYDAVQIDSISSSAATGLVGIPFRSITLEIQQHED